MEDAPHNGGRKDLQRAVKLREERSDRWRREGERSIWQNLSMIGALGWLIVVPILVGVFAGRDSVEDARGCAPRGKHFGQELVKRLVRPGRATGCHWKSPVGLPIR